MRPDERDLAYLQDMLDAGEAVVRHAAGRTREELDTNEMLRDAVERRVEVFGEAARRVSQGMRNAHPEIPWQKIMATRNILAHEYDEVDEDVLWRIATQHIPETLVQLRRLLPP
jgi:uncharacterized protein with HEPN domain